MRNPTAVRIAALLALSAAVCFLWAKFVAPRSPEGGASARTADAHASPPVPVAAEASSMLAAHPSASPSATPEDRRRLAILEEIFRAKNDNDPRLDHELRDLTPGTKALLLEKYRALPRERLNERGTIVFLIGREPKTDEDFAFLAEAGSEPPCLSLGDCAKSEAVARQSIHEEAAVSVTMTYPQQIAVKSLENLLSQAQASGGGDPGTVRDALDALARIARSPSAPLARRAEALEAQYSALGR